MEPTPKPKRVRKYNPAWKDSRENRAARQRVRRAKMKEFAQAQGYTSWEALATAILNGEVKIVKKDDIS
jgi:hypothetical protein